MRPTYFSIVIPVHNRASTLPLCIDSILSQTYPNFELILVDDHSEDNSIQIIKDYQKKDNRIKLFQEPDNKHGAQAARNTGIYNSSYDWIMFNDSDDTWIPEKIEKEYELLKSLNFSEDVVIYSDCQIIDLETNETRYWKLSHISSQNSFKDLLVKSGPMFQSLLCSKNLLKKVDFLDETTPRYQEWDTSIRLAEYGKFFHIEEALYTYYIGAADTMSKNQVKSLIGKCNIYIKYKDDILKFHGMKIYKKLLAETYKEISENANFDSLIGNNEILISFRTLLIKYFGKNYKIKTIKFLNPSFIKRLFLFSLRIIKKIVNK